MKMARGFDYTTTLGVCWSKEENDWKIYFPRKPDGWYIYSIISDKFFENFLKELEEAGYDLKTLRFSIRKKELGKPKRSNSFDYSTTLGVSWSKQMKDWRIFYPSKSDGWILHDFIKGLSLECLMEDLVERGYEPETFKLWVKKIDKDSEG